MTVNVSKAPGRTSRAWINFRVLDFKGAELSFKVNPGTAGAKLIIEKNGRRVVECSVERAAFQAIIDNFQEVGS